MRSTATAHTRRRPALNCAECRRRKVRCDRKDPCGRCSSLGKPCVFKEFRDDAQPSPSRSRPLPPRATNLPLTPSSQPEPAPGDQPTTTTRALEKDTAPGFQSRHDQVAAGAGNFPGPYGLPHGHEPRGDDSQGLASGQSFTELTPDSPAQRSTLVSLLYTVRSAPIELNKTRTLRWSHMIGSAQEYEQVSACFGAAFGLPSKVEMQPGDEELHKEIRGLLQRCKHIAKQIKATQSAQCHRCTDLMLSLPGREQADEMARTYFTYFESAYRILHQPTFWEDYSQFWANPSAAQMDLRLKVLLVLAIGASIQPFGDDDEDRRLRQMVHQWIMSAHDWLAGPLKKDRLELSALQIHCLLLLARQIYPTGADLVWISAGSLIHSAMQMGFHRDPRQLPSMPFLQAEMRRKLWWTVVEILVQGSLDCAMPPRISLDEFDTLPPANLDDDELMGGEAEVQSHPRNQHTAASAQLLLIDSLPLRISALRRLTSVRSKVPYEEALSISKDLSQACRRSNDHFKSIKDDQATRFQRLMLDMLVRRLIIPLNGRYVSQSRKNTSYYYARKLALDATASLMASNSDPHFSRLITRGGGMFKECFRYLCSMVTMELVYQTDTQAADGTLESDRPYRQIMKDQTTELIELSAARVRRGETNVKSHQFLTMILSQCEAIERGLPVTTAVARSATDSLKYCAGLLREHAAGEAGATPAEVFSPGPMLFSEEDGFMVDFDADMFPSWPVFPFFPRLE